MGSKKYLVLTVDVEALPHRAHDNHVDRLIWGRFQGEEFGISKMMDIADKHGVPMSFFLDVCEIPIYGNSICDVGKEIVRRGYDLQLHTHPLLLPSSLWESWGYAPPKTSPSSYNINECKKIITQSLQWFNDIANQQPIAYRAGAYRYNQHTLEVAANLGIKLCFNYNINSKGLKHQLLPNTVSQIFCWDNGVYEIPVGNLILENNQIASFTHPNSKFLLKNQHKTIEYIEKFFDIPENDILVMVFHSWSFLNREGEIFNFKDTKSLDNFDALLSGIPNYIEICDSKGILKKLESHEIETPITQSIASANVENKKLSELKPFMNNQSIVEDSSIYKYENIKIKPKDKRVFDFEIKSEYVLKLKGSCLYDRRKDDDNDKLVDNNKAALVIVQFLDINSQVIDDKYQNLTFSNSLQNYYHYIKASSNKTRALFELKLFTPENAVKLRLVFQTWNSQENLVFSEILLEKSQIDRKLCCNLCNSSNFVDYQNRKSARCARCGSLERTRIFYSAYNMFIKPYYSFSDKDILVCGASQTELHNILDKHKSLVSFDIRSVDLYDLQMDITNMNRIDNESFDTFIAMSVLQFVEDDIKAIDEVHRVLRKEGRIFIHTNVRCSELYTKKLKDNPLALRSYGLGDIIKLLGRRFIVQAYHGCDTITSAVSPIFCGIKE